MLSKFPLLLLGETLFVVAFSLERQGVEWVLRLLFVEDITLAIFPVREALLVVTCANYWLSLVNVLVVFLQRWLNVVTLVNDFVSCVAVHFVWIDDLGFFFKVECLWCLDHQGALPIQSEVLLVAA